VILTVTLNPALDKSYTVDSLVPNGSHRVRSVVERAGGKGVNVASVLHDVGVPCIALVLAGGDNGSVITADLEARGIALDVVQGAGESRRTVNVVSQESGDATIFNEPGPSASAVEIAAVVARVQQHVVAGATVVAVCGSLPQSVGSDAYALVVLAARAAGARTIVDAEGSALRAACAAGADIAMPNRSELLAATDTDEESAGVKVLQSWGAEHVLVSSGSEGLRAVLGDGRTLVARPGRRLRGNPTGAGDAATAAVAAGLATSRAWPDILRDAVAWSGAAVLQPVAGSVHWGDIVRLRESATVAEE
jgi:tagatose 6-phosphate kinase